MNANTTYLIIGASLAGAKAAEALRAEGFDGPLILIGDETEPPYERPSLSKDYRLRRAVPGRPGTAPLTIIASVSWDTVITPVAGIWLASRARRPRSGRASPVPGLGQVEPDVHGEQVGAEHAHVDLTAGQQSIHRFLGQMLVVIRRRITARHPARVPGSVHLASRLTLGTAIARLRGEEVGAQAHS